MLQQEKTEHLDPLVTRPDSVHTVRCPSCYCFHHHHTTTAAAAIPKSQIRKVRDRVTQLEQIGVPEDALDGHAYHTYTLTSPDNSVQFVFKHNVQGRSMYAEGTVDAVLFLAKQRREGAKQCVYTMADVVGGGYLR